MRRDKHAPEVSVRGAQLTHGQMPCPDCQATIILPFQSMFTGQPIWCSSCGLRLCVDVAASQDALNALQKAQAMLSNLRESAQHTS